MEINPDRAYALSLRGVARDAALGYGVAFRDPADLLPVDAGRGRVVPGARRRPGRLPGVRRPARSPASTPTAPTPRWLARRVQLAGMRPISLAVDVTNYVMLELGQPIHGYDRDRLRGPIVVRRARPGETLRTLDGEERRARPRGPADHRRPRPDRAGRGDGWRVHRDLGATTSRW